ncbi:MAG: cyclic nucleotide-binding domain-containing protein [Gammaproteobacteria bacterium]|nr:cyclic nucleotide-binding domain-containing protein [Gammaproteobacteria bacterium]
MRSLESARLPRARLAGVLAAIPFFARVQALEPAQLQVLLDHARLLELQPGEVVIRRGEFDSWFFFVLKGQLKVGLEDDGTATLALLRPGEIFGALAVICDSERSATIRADDSGAAVLLGVDSAPFGELEEIDVISAATKQAFLETVLAALRERLLAYRGVFPEHALAKHWLPEVADENGRAHELPALAEEIERLSEILVGWNASLDEAQHRAAAARIPGSADLVASWEALLNP